MSDLSYPIGKFSVLSGVSSEERKQSIAEISQTPAKIRAAVKGLSETQLDTPYRPGGWTPRQVVHHVADSHMNAFIRFKLALTEENPTIKPYAEDLWAKLDDARLPVDTSLNILDHVHHRWDVILRAIKDSDWSRTMNHPQQGTRRLDQVLALYDWHGRHHVAHITGLRERMGW